MNVDKLDIILLSIMLLCIGGILIEGINYITYRIELKNSIVIYNSSCDNLNLSETAYCLVQKINKNYNYTITNDSETRDFEDIVLNGGDCFDYTRLYEHLANLENYSTKRVELEISDTSGHIFLIMYDPTGYCKLELNKSAECSHYYSNPFTINETIKEKV